MKLKLFYGLLFLLLSGCSAISTYRTEQNLDNKIEFDLTRLNQDGLYGVSDGKRALSYEFCIPANMKTVEQILAIDPSAIIYKDSQGRATCTDQQFLVMGDTFQRQYLLTLQNLVNLHYVTRIVEAHFE